jgi:hypothetical protein
MWLPRTDTEEIICPRSRRAISVPLAPVKTGIWRSLADSQPRSSGHMGARKAPIPKLIVRVRFPSPAPTPNPQIRWPTHRTGHTSRDAPDRRPGARSANKSAAVSPMGERGGARRPGPGLEGARHGYAAEAPGSSDAFVAIGAPRVMTTWFTR